VHGFKGSSHDVRNIKNAIFFVQPDSVIICSSINENAMDDDIRVMGIKLAGEVLDYIAEYCSIAYLGRVSFIGHSLGGLIIRSALPMLDKIADKMYLFMTLATPHLGYIYKSSKLVNFGISILKNWKRSTCLSQITLNETKNLR
jgi:hypothetical protein